MVFLPEACQEHGFHALERRLSSLLLILAMENDDSRRPELPEPACFFFFVVYGSPLIICAISQAKAGFIKFLQNGIFNPPPQDVMNRDT